MTAMLGSKPLSVGFEIVAISHYMTVMYYISSR
jgi:hypothetical protein